MATMAPVPTSTTTITPPSSSHGTSKPWRYSGSHTKELAHLDTRLDFEHIPKNYHDSQDADHIVSSQHTGILSTTRRNNSNDHLPGNGRARRSVDGEYTSSHNHEPKKSPNLDENSWAPVPQTNGNDQKRSTTYSLGNDQQDEESKWIHRDKLARIESEELQAAGIFIPRTRAPSKQRRDRSRSAMRRGADSSEQTHNRSRKNSAVAEPRSSEPVLESWDLRTPEEIAAEEANQTYFTSNNHKSGSRIPVAKISPAPIPLDYLERATPAPRKPSDSPEGPGLAFPKTRPRSASLKDPDINLGNSNLVPAKRSVTDGSPKKNPPGSRKSSAASRGTATTGRPKTRSGSNKDSNGGTATRPSTRSGEFSINHKAPEGDPPWMVNSYKPDPRLPPDQQLLPTVARRLQQEKWEKEGKFGDVYDREFRPLNENVFLRPPDKDKGLGSEEESQQPADEWPLKVESANKSPTLRQGSYSTMPKISDKPPLSPLPSPRTPVTPHTPQHEQTSSRPEKNMPERIPPQADDQKDGCGCCVVM